MASDRAVDAEAAGALLRVREWGPEDGRPLLFWHGLGPWGELQLNEAGPAWAERGIRSIAPAAPGAGVSPALAEPDAYRLPRLADLVVALADALGLGRFDYAGFSWGASIGVHLAVRHPERLRSLVLLDAGYGDVEGQRTREELERDFAAQQAAYAFADDAELVAAVRERRRSWRPALAERHLAGVVERDGRLVVRADPRAAAWAYHALQLDPPTSTHEALAGCGVPVLLLASTERAHGDELARFTEAVPAAEVHVLDSGHDLLADAPEETIRLVGDWLDGLATAPGR